MCVLHCQSLLILLFKEIGRTLYSLSTNNFYYYVLILIYYNHDTFL